MINSRKEKFLAFENHPWLKRLFYKLTKSDIDFAINFLEKNSNDDKNEIAAKIYRLFLENPNKPRAWKEIEELLISSL